MNNNYFTTATALLNTLADRGFPAQLFQSHDGFQIRFPWYEGADITVNTLTGGKLESYGFPWDDGDTTTASAEWFASQIFPLWKEVTY